MGFFDKMRQAAAKDAAARFIGKHHKENLKRQNYVNDRLIAYMWEPTVEKRIDSILNAVKDLKEYKEWCSKFPGGKEYFAINYESGSDNEEQKLLQCLQYELEVQQLVIPKILSLAEPSGVLQKDLYGHFDQSKDETKKIVEELAEQKAITKEKKGNSYLLRRV